MRGGSGDGPCRPRGHSADRQLGAAQQSKAEWPPEFVYVFITCKYRKSYIWIINFWSSYLTSLNFWIAILSPKSYYITLKTVSLFPSIVLITDFMFSALSTVSGTLLFTIGDVHSITRFFGPTFGGDPVFYQHVFCSLDIQIFTD